MEELAKFITDERTGLKYELCGDYYIIAGGDEPKREPNGVWGRGICSTFESAANPFTTKC